MARSELVGATPAQRHRLVAAAFADRVEGVNDWEAPAPVAGWTARDVVGHLVEWLPGFLAGGSDVALAAVDAGADPVAAWHARADEVQAILDDPATASRRLVNPHTGEWPLDAAIDRFYTVDVFMHTWDLARATGQDDRLDEAFCAELVAGMASIEELLRSSGQYGPAVSVPDGADARTRLIGFIGRDPSWLPASAA
jgi:uncharacterized protein (TIGR03086 family)